VIGRNRARLRENRNRIKDETLVCHLPFHPSATLHLPFLLPPPSSLLSPLSSLLSPSSLLRLFFCPSAFSSSYQQQAILVADAPQYYLRQSYENHAYNLIYHDLMENKLLVDPDLARETALLIVTDSHFTDRFFISNRYGTTRKTEREKREAEDATTR
jgi:hypothetical protein